MVQKKYELVFKITEEIWLLFYVEMAIKAGYGDTNFIFIYQKPRLEVFLADKDKDKPGKIGLGLYSDSKKTKKFVSDCRSSFSKVDSFLETVDARNLGNQSRKKLLTIFKKSYDLYLGCLGLYKYTEVFYSKSVEKIITDFFTEKISDVTKRNEVISKILNPKNEREYNDILEQLNVPESVKALCDNVLVVGKEKLVFREAINKMANFFEQLTVAVGKQFDMSFRQVESCLYDEILELFSAIDEARKEEIVNLSNRRSDAFAAVKKRAGWGFLTGEKFKKIVLKVGFEIPKNTREIKGDVASTGKVRGKVIVMPIGIGQDNLKLLKKKNRGMRLGDVLVAKTTGPEMIMACKKAGAIVADEGGINSHAAIIAREFKIPCIVNTKIATDVLEDGNFVEVDASAGIVKIINRE